GRTSSLARSGLPSALRRARPSLRLRFSGEILAFWELAFSLPRLLKSLCNADVSTPFLAACAAFAAACDNSGASLTVNAGVSGAGASALDAGADGGNVEPVPDGLSFVPVSIVELSPKETRLLTVQTSPAG